MSATVTAVVVSYSDPEAALRAVDSLLAQSHRPVETIVVDNDPGGATAAAATRDPRSASGGAVPDVGRPPSGAHAPSGARASSVRVVHPGENLGYVGAFNLAAELARGDWIFFLNPDAVAAPDCLQRLLDAVDGEDVGIAGAQVLLPDGRVNAGENPVSITGIAWSGGYGQPREHGPARDVAGVSGAALLARRDALLALGGACPHFFMYYDDVDLAWRMRLSGRRVRYCPRATVTHDYEFQKGSHKWLHLERNRLWALMSNLEARTLVLLAPLLLATELAVSLSAVRGGWWREKARGWASMAASAGDLRRWRRRVQSARNVSDCRILEGFVGGIRTPLLHSSLPGSAPLDPPVLDKRLARPANALLDRYRRLLLALLKGSAGQ